MSTRETRDEAIANDYKAIEMLVKAAKPFRDGFTYDPGHSDLDNEQPIHVRVTLGDWRLLNFALGRCE